MKQSVCSELSEITQALDTMASGDKRSREYFDKCVDCLLKAEAKTDDERRNVVQACLTALDRLAAVLPNGDAEILFCRSVVMLIRGDLQGYLAETENFLAAKNAENIPEWLNCYVAYRYFILIGLCLPVLWDRDDQFTEDILRSYQALATKYFPESAFDLECKFMLSKGPDQEKIRLLRAILEKDQTWTPAWLMLGGPHYEDPAWSQPLDEFREALAGDVAHYGDLLFRAACAADTLDDHDAAFDYYRECAEHMLGNTEYYQRKTANLTPDYFKRGIENRNKLMGLES